MSRIDAARPQSPPEGSGEAGAALRPGQFTLREAFWWTTIAAGAALLVRLQGWGSLLLSSGLFLAWLNARGRLWAVHTPRARPKVFSAAWLVLGVSLFLPAAKGCNNSTISGWQAAYTCALAEVEVAQKLVVERDWIDAAGRAAEGDWPAAGELARRLGEAAWITLVNLANLLALLSPLLLWRLRRGQGERPGAVLAVAAVAVWAVPLEPGFLIGCYVWGAGFLLLTIAYPIGWKTFSAMAALATAFVFL